MRDTMRRTNRTWTAAAALAALVACGNAHAAFPGTDGRIAFESMRSGNWEVWVMEPNGTDPVPVAPWSSVDRAPAWSPDGAHLAFHSNRSGNFDIWIVDADGMNLRRLTTNPAHEIQPAWSPDGTRIAFARTDPLTGTNDIWIVDVSGATPATDLTNHLANDIEPAWSPDGTRVAFASDRDGQMEIYVQPVADASSDAAVNLTFDPAADRHPSWSPDGERIAFASDRGDFVNRLYTMFPDGTIQDPVPGTEPGDRDPAFSPDGLSIVFARPSANGFDEIHVLRLVEESATGLTDNGALNGGPDWQPIPMAEEENHPPSAHAGADGEIACAGAEGGLARLDGTGSTDPDSTPGTNDDIAVFEWFVGFGTAEERLLGTDVVLETMLPPGVNVVTLRVTDARGLSDVDDAIWTVLDPDPASIEVSVDPAVLWPPDHRLVPVHADVVVRGGRCGEGSGFVLVSVVSSDPDDGTGDGDTSGDIAEAAIGTPDVDLLLRAERSGTGRARTYTLTYAAGDGSEGAATATATVVVPGDRRAVQSAGERRLFEKEGGRSAAARAAARTE